MPRDRESMPTSWRANGSRECAPDDRLRDAIQCHTARTSDHPRATASPLPRESRSKGALLRMMSERTPGAQPSSTQKPVTQGCGRVSGGTIDVDENTMPDRTSQPGFELLLHSTWDGLPVPRPSQRHHRTNARGRPTPLHASWPGLGPGHPRLLWGTAAETWMPGTYAKPRFAL